MILNYFFGISLILECVSVFMKFVRSFLHQCFYLHTNTRLSGYYHFVVCFEISN